MKRIIHLLMFIVMLSMVITACSPAQATSAPAATQAPAQQNTTAPSTGGYQAMTVTGGGTISGKITYSGAPVAPKEVTVDKDVDKCGQTKTIAKVKTDSSGGLADAVVRITDIKTGKALDGLGSNFVLDQKDCLYNPTVLIVPVGKEVTIKNSDGILHNVHTTPFDNPPLNVAQPGTKPEITSQAFTIPENIPVGCDVHKWMYAYIIVVDNPYAVVTGADGSFTLKDVPAGNYTVEVWHGELGKKTATVTVAAGQEAKVDVEYK